MTAVHIKQERGKDLLSMGPGWSHRPHAHEAATDLNGQLGPKAKPSEG